MKALILKSSKQLFLQFTDSSNLDELTGGQRRTSETWRSAFVHKRAEYARLNTSRVFERLKGKKMRLKFMRFINWISFFRLKSPRADVVMVITRSKSIVKTNSLTKTKRGSLGSLTSLTEKNDSLECEGMSMQKSMHASKSMEMDLDNISNEGERN